MLSKRAPADIGGKRWRQIVETAVVRVLGARVEGAETRMPGLALRVVRDGDAAGAGAKVKTDNDS